MASNGGWQYICNFCYYKLVFSRVFKQSHNNNNNNNKKSDSKKRDLAISRLKSTFCRKESKE